ncbi:RNA polymerase Rpb4 [Nitzschia inconspicua]|uniref:RNA polymerase Rpb4 n=1 Tax=Nitzschia inconspicua TaxID=303405 RepID=A0A9K3Q512_9STRA|nr:RNA polymerase Rpb4 [Nitzschia inconspicua]
MECLTDTSSPKPVLLPNAEVLEMLQRNVKNNKHRLFKIQEAAKRNKKKQHGAAKKQVIQVDNKFKHRDWIEEKVLQYLKRTPCVQLSTNKIDELKFKCSGIKRRSSALQRTHRDDKRLRQSKSMDAAANDDNATSYGLTEAETLQVLNFMPKEPVEIHLMVEELHARMSEDQQSEFLSMVQSYSKHHNSKNKKNRALDTTEGTEDYENEIVQEEEEEEEEEEDKLDAEEEEVEDAVDVSTVNAEEEEDLIAEEECDKIIVKEEQVTI